MLVNLSQQLARELIDTPHRIRGYKTKMLGLEGFKELSNPGEATRFPSTTDSLKKSWW